MIYYYCRPSLDSMVQYYCTGTRTFNRVVVNIQLDKDHGDAGAGSVGAPL